MLLFLGILFGSFAPRDAWWRSRAFRAGLAAAAVFTIVAFVSYAVAPDWMWMYFFTPSDVAWTLPGIAAGYVLVFVIAFAGAVGLKPLGRRASIAAATGMLMGELGIVAITWSRYHLVGTTREWVAGDAHELFTASPSGPVATIGVLAPLSILVIAVALYVTWRSSRAAPAGR